MRDTVANRVRFSIFYLVIGLADSITGWFFLPTSAYVNGWAILFILSGMIFTYLAWCEWTDRYGASE